MANFADGGKTIIVTGARRRRPPLPNRRRFRICQRQLPLFQLRRNLAGPRFFVLIDPAHGGSEIGAAISPTLPEKDVVLALARRVQHELAKPRHFCRTVAQFRHRHLARPARDFGQCRSSRALHRAACC